ncbi:MAG: flavodoxin family protein [Cloacibacillus evryensis]
MADKKVMTILLGSPRKEGNSEQLADSLAKGAGGNGYEVRKVRLAAKKLNGCLDCRKCWSAGTPCIQRDDMDSVYGTSRRLRSSSLRHRYISIRGAHR